MIALRLGETDEEAVARTAEATIEWSGDNDPAIVANDDVEDTGRDEATERDVDPMRLLVVEGRPYLEGWCLRAEGVRLFRLDRMLSLDVLDVPSAPPAEAEPVDVDQGLFRPSPDDVLVELELSAAGRWVAEYYPCESVTDLEDGRLRVGLRTPDSGWVRRLALRLGEDGRVVSPPSLVVEVREAAGAALANYVVLSPGTRGSARGTCGNCIL